MATPMIPYLPIETRQEAAKRSLQVRRDRAAIKRIIANGASYAHAVELIGVVWSPTSPAVKGMKVYDLLCALPGIGKARALSLLEQAGIPEKNTVRACGPRQTERLFALLG